jgi:hypothetical protein
VSGEWTFLTADIRTNSIIAELPVANSQVSQVLNGVGSLTGDIPLSVPLINNVDIDAATLPRRTAIYAIREDLILFGGIIWTRSFQPSTNVLRIGAGDFWSYYAHRRIKSTLTYTATDQLAIAQAIMNYTKVAVGGDIGVLIGTDTSGKNRDATYNSYETKVVQDAVTQLSALEGGFDFSIDLVYDVNVAGGIRKNFRLWYPRKGSSFLTTGLMWELPGAILDYTYPEDGSSCANDVVSLGSGNGPQMLISESADPNQVTQGYPLLEDVTSYKDVVVQATLDDHAKADVRARSGLIVLPTFDVRADVDPIIGSYSVGDEARFRITDTRFPKTLDTFFRIIMIETTPPSDTSPELVKLTCGAIFSG